jgi:hypothetical protein
MTTTFALVGSALIRVRPPVPERRERRADHRGAWAEILARGTGHGTCGA